MWSASMLPRLEECLEKLTPKARQVLALRYGAEHTNEQIGSLLGGSKQYIGRLIAQCLEKLRRCLEQQTSKRRAQTTRQGATWR
jgi:RNA polymerase sigma factor (sigma-70 family)